MSMLSIILDSAATPRKCGRIQQILSTWECLMVTFLFKAEQNCWWTESHANLGDEESSSDSGTMLISIVFPGALFEIAAFFILLPFDLWTAIIGAIVAGTVGIAAAGVMLVVRSASSEERRRKPARKELMRVQHGR
jgi:VIT1/CCC1 family predicted Fe2+/Mn2+ transporter